MIMIKNICICVVGLGVLLFSPLTIGKNLPTKESILQSPILLPIDPPNRYLGFSGGSGRITNKLSITNTFFDSTRRFFSISDTLLIPPAVQEIISRIFKINTSSSIKKGGFSGRVFGGYFFSFAPNFNIGPEIGISIYPGTTKKEKSQLFIPLTSPFGNLLQLNSTTQSHGEGADVLLNAAYSITCDLELNIKPGIQYARERTKVGLEVNAISELIPIIRSSFTKRATKILPEIMVGADWKPVQTLPLYIDMSYQRVFGTNEGLTKQVSTREMVTFGLEYRY